MYQMLGAKRLLTSFGTVAALGALIYSWFDRPAQLSGFWPIASKSVTICFLAVLVLGQTPLFPLLCRLPLLRNLFPPIDGRWRGEFTSNFAIIAKAHDLPAQTEDAPVIADFEIKARLFEVTISAVSSSPRPGYMRSDTTAFSIRRSAHTGRIVIHYVFDATVGDPRPSDAAGFHGAAQLRILGKGKEMELHGSYWTDRNWHRGQNTAGTLTLRRPAAADTAHRAVG